MPNFRIGNMWEVFEKADRFIVLSCSTLTPEGDAVMSSGMAAELVARFPNEGIQRAIGHFIAERCGVHGIFGLRAEAKVGVFQDRRHYQDETDLACLGTACRMLRETAAANPTLHYHVEMPGKGSPFWMIKGPIEMCPENVTFWNKP